MRPMIQIAVRFKRVALVLALCVLTTLALLSAPKPASALRCHCTSAHNTRTYTGTGSTCDAAQSSVFSQGASEADVDCSGVDGVCNDTLVITSPCTFDSGTGLYSASGHVSYTCDVCI